MSPTGPVTYWIDRLKAGDPRAAQQLWDCYFQRLVKLARQKLHDIPRQVADEEDVAISAFQSLCEGAERGQFPQLHDRDDLWQLLVMITARKAIDLKRHQGREKRGGGEAAGHVSLEEIISREPTPEFAAEMAEECQRLLQQLGDDSLQNVALLKMEGYTTNQIATRLGCVPRTIERKLRVIRNFWAKELAP
jgi:RNA polymerase sigma factor (sigma-70 family)